MGIWIWIVAAWVISYLALGKEKVRFEHLLWILLPVDMYGISIAGATIKPYMIFCAILFVRLLLRRNKGLFINRWLLAGGVLTVLTVIVNLMNCESLSAAKAACMLVVVWVCLIVYVNSCGESMAKDIPNAMVAAGIGYGVIFLAGYILLQCGFSLLGMLTDTRTESGFFLQTANMYQGSFVQVLRLRGFTIDPNTMLGTFLFCSVCCLLRISKGMGRFREWFALLLSCACILLSNSRMGILCFCVLTVLALIIGYRIASVRAQNWMKVLCIIGVLSLLLLITLTDVEQKVVTQIVASYDNRSGLNDEYGRFSIWREAISVFWRENPLIGTGMGQMRTYTSMARDCHNTWLAMLCDNGIIVGGLLLMHFVVVLSFVVIVIRRYKKIGSFDNKQLVWSLALGTLIVMVSLVAVDNITYSYLWFGSAILSVLFTGLKREWSNEVCKV